MTYISLWNERNVNKQKEKKEKKKVKYSILHKADLKRMLINLKNLKIKVIFLFLENPLMKF